MRTCRFVLSSALPPTSPLRRRGKGPPWARPQTLGEGRKRASQRLSAIGKGSWEFIPKHFVTTSGYRPRGGETRGEVANERAPASVGLPTLRTSRYCCGRSLHGVAARRRFTPAGYRMIETLDVTNFRCFETLKLESLRRVNILTGANASGKTALLESLLIGAIGSPEGMIRSNRLRGGQEFFSLGPQNFKSFWAPWFNNLDQQIVISYADDEKVTRALKIYFSAQATAAGTGRNQSVGATQAQSITPILFDRILPNNRVQRLVGSLNPQGQPVFQAAANYGPITYIFPATLASSEADNVTWFSDIKINGRADEVVEQITSEFPFIKDLEVLAPGGIQAIYAKLDRVSRPLSQISAGIHKILSVYSGISAIEKGVVLIDEIENGIYYEKYESVWRGIVDLCKRRNNQVFITSHSLECLKALVPVLEENLDDFSLIRTERRNGKCVAIHTSGASMKAAIEMGGEIRGVSVGATTH
jgi:AAA domain, putative AbiEii toxin, Type IV TA system/AAA domain